MRFNKIVFKVDGFDIREYHSKSRAPRQRIFVPGEPPKWLHHYMVEKYIRPLEPGEVVHHKDNNPLNNTISNLEIMTRADHVRYHKPMLGYKFTEEQRKTLRDSHLGQTAWNKGKRGFKHSKKSRENMSKAQKGRKITWGAKISKAKTKVTKVKLIEYLRKNPSATAKDIKKKFGFVSNCPIFNLGGLRRLKKEVVR